MLTNITAMKTLIITASIITAFATAASAQTIPDLYPTGYQKVLSDEAAAKWDPVENEIMGSYWNIIGEGCSWYCGNGGPIKIEASSRLKSQGNNNYNESHLHDLSYQTTWVEGVSGYGIGEWIKYTFKANNPRITNIHVVNGYCKSQSAWRNNSRVKKLKVYVNDRPLAMLNLEDKRSDQNFEIAPMTDTREWTMKFEIVDVYQGDKWDDTALSEIYFDGLDVHCFAANTKIMVTETTTRNIEEIKEGDMILAYDPDTKQTFQSKVLETAKVPHDNIVCYTFDDGRHITATDDHPFLTTHGWASSNPAKTAAYKGFGKVSTLTTDDFIITNEGTVGLVAITRPHQRIMTYTIVKLSQGNVFFANGMAVGTEEVK